MPRPKIDRLTLRHLTLVLALVAAVALAPAAFTQPPAGAGAHAGDAPGLDVAFLGDDGEEHLDHGPGLRLRALARILELSDSQLADAEVLAEDLRAELQPLVEARRALRGELRDLLAGPSPDPTEVGVVVVELDALGDQARAARESYDAAFNDLLTAEQQASYEVVKKTLRFCGRRPGARR